MSKRRPKHHATEQPCGVCDRPVLAAFVCRDCMDRYHGHLAAVPDLDAELRIEHTRRAVKGSGVSGRGAAEQPLAWVEAASRAMTELHDALVAACRVLALEQPLPVQHVTAVCAWLAEREGSIPLRPEGPTIVADLDAAMQQGWKVCDNPPEKALRGRCACGEELRSAPGAAVVRCPSCGHQWRGEEVDEATQAHIVEHLASWDELAGFAYGHLRVPRGTLDSWQRRGRLRPASSGMDGEALYRVGDLLNLDEQRRTRAS